MKNKERYQNEMLRLFMETCPCEFRMKYIFKAENCIEISCSDCIRITKEWFEQEYIKKPTLSKTEKFLLESIDDKWKFIARDTSGDLYIYKTEPYRVDGVWEDNEQCTDFILFNHLFQFIERDDEEPYNIEDLLKNCEIKE